MDNEHKAWHKFIECSCHTEGIMVSGEYLQDGDPEPFVDMAYWAEGYDGRKLGFWQRLRFAFHILRTGKPWNDMICLDKKSAEELVWHLVRVFDLNP